MPLVNLSAYKASAAPGQIVTASVGNVLAISAEGLNGANSNTFTDSSAHNLISAKTGKIGVGPQSPHYNNTYGVQFNGISSYVRALNTANLNLNQGDWTIDGSFCATKPIVGNACIFSFGSTGGGQTPYIPFYLAPSGHLVFEEAAANAGLYNMTMVFAPIINQFYHFAITRRNNVIYVYIDGVLRGTKAWTDAHQQGLDFNAGCLQYSSGTQWFFAGVVSNIRIVKNISLYTADFTPSLTAPVVNANTSLQLCTNRSFKDASLNEATVVVAGLPKVVNRSPFKPLAALAQNGSSGYFDGSSFIEVTTAGESIPGSGAFCMEAWIYPIDASVANAIFGNIGGTGTSCSLTIQPTGRVDLNASSGSILNSNTANVQFNAWNHVVFCRNVAGLGAIFIGGIRTNSTTNAVDIDSTSPWRIGSVGVTDDVAKFKGHLSGVRLLTGNQGYDPTQTALAIPSAPSINNANTSFLYNFVNTGIVDHSLSSAIASMGSAQISTTKFKKGASSLLFNGTTDYLVVEPSNAYELTNDFTIEFWINPEASVIEGDLIGNYVSNTAQDWMCLRSAAGTIVWYPGGAGAFIQSPVVADNQWHSIALVRIGSTCTMYINGTAVGGTLAKADQAGDATRPVYIGSRGISSFFKGNIDDVQITNGQGRYNQNYTPSDE